MSSNQSGEGDIRKNLIEADVVDCMVALPGQLFYATQIPACLWFLRRDKRRLPSPSGRRAGGEGGVTDRRGHVLFVDARKLGRMMDRTHRELTAEDIARELVKTVRANVTIDWTLRENVRAQLRVLVKRILRKYGYPPDKQEKATRTVLEQAEVLSQEWATA